MAGETGENDGDFYFQRPAGEPRQRLSSGESAFTAVTEGYGSGQGQGQGQANGQGPGTGQGQAHSQNQQNQQKSMAPAASTRLSFGPSMSMARSTTVVAAAAAEEARNQKERVTTLAKEIEEDWPLDNPYAQPFHSLLEVQLRVEAKLEAFLKKKMPTRPRKAPPSFHLDFFDTPQQSARNSTSNVPAGAAATAVAAAAADLPDLFVVPEEGCLPQATFDKHNDLGLDVRAGMLKSKATTTPPLPTEARPASKGAAMPASVSAVAAAVASARQAGAGAHNDTHQQQQQEKKQEKQQQQQQKQQTPQPSLDPPVAPEPKLAQDGEGVEEEPTSVERVRSNEETTQAGKSAPPQPRPDRPLQSLTLTSSQRTDRNSKAVSIPSSRDDGNRDRGSPFFRRGKSSGTSTERSGSGVKSRFAVQEDPEAPQPSSLRLAFHNQHQHSESDSNDDSLDESRLRRKTVAGSIIFPPNPGESYLEMLVNTRFFELLSGVIIITNAVFIGYETQYIAVHGATTDAYSNMNIAFSVYFIMELAMRLAAYRGYFFTNMDYRWNVLDFAMVLTSLVDLFFTFSTSLASAGRSLRHVRLFRLARTIRIVRTLKAVREFHKMVYALLSSLRTLMCSLLILFFVMYFFAIIFCQAVSDSELDSDDSQNLTLLKEYYEDLPRSFYALFMSATNGISWTQVHEPLANLHWVYGACFLAYIAMIFFGVMNVVTSVFVESAIMSAQHYKDLIIQEKQHEKDIAMSHMKQVFEQIDEDGSGEITIDEMEVFLQQTHLKKYMEALNISAQDTRMLFRLLDRDGSRKIDINEFSEGCLRLQGEAKSFDIHSMIFTIKQFLGKWSEFTDYVEDCFERLFPFDYDDEDGPITSTSMTPEPSATMSPRRGPGSTWMAGAMSKVASQAPNSAGASTAYRDATLDL